jgi:flavin-dependent dehydrogenase
VIVIRGGGPAGAAAAIAALQLGSPAKIIEKSRFPRHKVCGEFLSPEAVPLLEQAGISFPEAAKVRRISLVFAKSGKSFLLPEPAVGISRYTLDAALIARAEGLGAQIAVDGPEPRIVAHGRHSRSSKGGRLFGFKAHFHGPANDVCELYFFGHGYVGVSPVERGFTNVCGVLPEELLRSVNFKIDTALDSFRPLRERLSPLTRTFDWLTVAPLVFEQQKDAPTQTYLAGDALSFVDPFTGSGMLCALASGWMAGEAAVRGEPVPQYLARCRATFLRAFRCSSFLRQILHTQWAEQLAPFLPGSLLYRLTRPSIA